MTAHDIAICKACAVIDRAYKDSPKEFFMVGQHARPGGAIRLPVFVGFVSI